MVVDPLVGIAKIVCNFCGLACILGLTSSNTQVSLTSTEHSASFERCPSTRVSLFLERKRKTKGGEAEGRGGEGRGRRILLVRQ